MARDNIVASITYSSSFFLSIYLIGTSVLWFSARSAFFIPHFRAPVVTALRWSSIY